MNLDSIFQKLESKPLVFSLLHKYGGGTDTNRRVFANLVSKGDIAVEIGANRGTYTALLSRLVGDQGRVHAFEPVQDNYERLSRTIEEAQSSNVHINQLAVGKAPGRQEMLMPAHDLQQASLIPHTVGSWSAVEGIRRESVHLTSIDAYLHQAQIQHVDFIKVDVEGGELAVLEGAIECLARTAPVLHLEINSAWLVDFGTSVAELLRFLDTLHYTFRYEVDAGYIRGYRKLDDWRSPVLRPGKISGDFIFSTIPL